MVKDMPDYYQALYTTIKNTWQDAENLDDTHGFISYIWIPEETFKVDLLKLHIYAEKFRAYSKSALAGGGTTETSEGGGKHRHMMLEYLKDTMGGYDTYEFGARSSAGVAVFLDVPSEVKMDIYTEQEIPDHTHDVIIPAHTHSIDFGIYEEDITGRTLSAILYDPDDNELCNFGVILTGEDSDVLNLSDYFETLNYGMYKLVLSASGKLRCRLVYYELCKMYAQ